MTVETWTEEAPDEDEEIRSMNVVFEEPAGYSSGYQVTGHLGLKFKEMLLAVDNLGGGNRYIDS